LHRQLQQFTSESTVIRQFLQSVSDLADDGGSDQIFVCFTTLGCQSQIVVQMYRLCWEDRTGNRSFSLSLDGQIDDPVRHRLANRHDGRQQVKHPQQMKQGVAGSHLSANNAYEEVLQLLQHLVIDWLKRGISPPYLGNSLVLLLPVTAVKTWFRSLCCY
jgi:hypothetical protein